MKNRVYNDTFTVSYRMKGHLNEDSSYVRRYTDDYAPHTNLPVKENQIKHHIFRHNSVGTNIITPAHAQL